MSTVLYNMDSSVIDLLLKLAKKRQDEKHKCSICEKVLLKSDIGGFKKGSYDLICKRTECLIVARSLDLVNE